MIKSEQITQQSIKTSSNNVEADELEGGSWTALNKQVENSRQTIFVGHSKSGKRGVAVPVSFVEIGLSMGLDLEIIKAQAQELGLVKYKKPKAA